MITLSESEFVDMMMSREAAEKVLNKVVNTAIEETLRYIPRVAAQYMKNAAAIQALTAEFLEKNAHFKEHRDVVEKVVFEVEAAHPGWTYKQVLDESAVKINSVLNSTKKIMNEQSALPFTVE